MVSMALSKRVRDLAAGGSGVVWLLGEVAWFGCRDAYLELLSVILPLGIFDIVPNQGKIVDFTQENGNFFHGTPLFGEKHAENGSSDIKNCAISTVSGIFGTKLLCDFFVFSRFRTMVCHRSVLDMTTEDLVKMQRCCKI